MEVELDVVEGFGAPKKEVMLEFTLGFLFAFESPVDSAPGPEESVFRFALDMVMDRGPRSPAGRSLRAGSPLRAVAPMTGRMVAAMKPRRRREAGAAEW